METFNIFQTLILYDKKFKNREIVSIILHYYRKTNKLIILRYKNEEYIEPILDNLYHLKILGGILNNKQRNNLIISSIRQCYNPNKKYLIIGGAKFQLEKISNLLQEKLKIQSNEIQIVSSFENLSQNVKFILIKQDKNFDYQLLLNYYFDMLICITPAISSFSTILDTCKNLNNKEIYYVYDDYGIIKNKYTKFILPDTFTRELWYLGK